MDWKKISDTIDTFSTPCIKSDESCCNNPDIVGFLDGGSSCKNCGSHLAYEMVHDYQNVSIIRKKRKPYDRFDYISTLLNKFKNYIKGDIPANLADKPIEYFITLTNGIALYNSSHNKTLLLRFEEIQQLKRISKLAQIHKKKFKHVPSVKTIVRRFLQLKGYQYYLFIKEIKCKKKLSTQNAIVDELFRLALD